MPASSRCLNTARGFHSTPIPIQNLVLLNPSEPVPQVLSDAPVNELHSHKVIMQLTAVKALVWHTAISYFLLPPTAISLLSSNLRLLLDIKYPYLMEIKLCIQTAHISFSFSFFLASYEYFLLHTVLIEESASIRYGKQLFSLLRSSENYFGLRFLNRKHT